MRLLVRRSTPARLGRSVAWLLALAAPVAAAWSPATEQLAQRARDEYAGRVLLLASLDGDAARELPAETLRELQSARSDVFPVTATRGVIVALRWHWFDTVRCAIHVPPHPQDPDAEFWALAHELGHCVARLHGWQDSLWRAEDVVERHRIESWADAFATMLASPPDRARIAATAQGWRAADVADAAYLTQGAIDCALRAAAPAAASLAEVGEAVQQRLGETGCLAEPARLRATDELLRSLAGPAAR